MFLSGYYADTPDDTKVIREGSLVNKYGSKSYEGPSKWYITEKKMKDEHVYWSIPYQGEKYLIRYIGFKRDDTLLNILPRKIYPGHEGKEYYQGKEYLSLTNLPPKKFCQKLKIDKKILEEYDPECDIHLIRLVPETPLKNLSMPKILKILKTKKLYLCGYYEGRPHRKNIFRNGSFNKISCGGESTW